MVIDSTAVSLATVRKLCERWHEMSRDEYHECITPTGVYVNMPKPGKRRIGPDEAFEALEPWRTRCKIDLDVINIQGDDRVVMAERLERFWTQPDEPAIELYVVGVFEMENGKIVQWRDYYESAHAPSVLLSS